MEITGAPLELLTDADPDGAWRLGREVVDSGRPALLLTDLYHLDHYGRSAHFPGHAVVLAGYDDEVAYLSDTGFEELQTTQLGNLALARHEGNPIFPLEGHMLHVPVGQEIPDFRAAAEEAIRRCAARMLEPSLGEFEGLPALRRFAAEVGDWPRVASDWQWCARFNYQAIERRGTGGGNFRSMYSRFLGEVGLQNGAELATAAASAWTGLAASLLAVSKEEEVIAEAWSEVSARAGLVLQAEERLWEALAGSSGRA